MKWISILAFAVAAASSAQAQSVTIGVTSVLSNTDSGNGGLLLAQKATLNSPATLESLSFYIVRVSGSLRLGLYDASGPNRSPGIKLAEVPLNTPKKGWNTYPVTPVNLPAGSYWLAYEVSNSNMQYRTSYGVGPILLADLPYGP